MWQGGRVPRVVGTYMSGPQTYTAREVPVHPYIAFHDQTGVREVLHSVSRPNGVSGWYWTLYYCKTRPKRPFPQFPAKTAQNSQN